MGLKVTPRSTEEERKDLWPREAALTPATSWPSARLKYPARIMHWDFVVLSGRLNALKKSHQFSLQHWPADILCLLLPKGEHRCQKMLHHLLRQFLHPCCLFTAPGPRFSHGTDNKQPWLVGSSPLALQRTNSCFSPPQSDAEASSHRSMVTQGELCPANTITSSWELLVPHSQGWSTKKPPWLWE